MLGYYHVLEIMHKVNYVIVVPYIIVIGVPAKSIILYQII